MQKRVLGRTGHKSTIIALGGAAVRPTNQNDVNSYIIMVLEHGVNHIDVAPTYGSGKAEIILGKWVKEYRDDLLDGVVTISAKGSLSAPGEEIEITAIPYYSWCNREQSQMRVWLPYRDHESH